MKDLELNKIFASILFVSLIMVGIGVIVDSLYKPSKVTQKGYHIEITADAGGAAAEEESLDIAALLASANIEKGKVIAKKCIACHTFDKGEPNKVGPNLWGVVGNKKAHLGSDFNYSKAILAQEGHWGYDELFHFLKKPQKYISGTKMAFAGISKPEQIADVVLYLHSMSDNPIPLPIVEKKADQFEEEVKNQQQEG